MQLYELAGADLDRRFSPYCWRTRYALRHKGLKYDTVPVRFTEKDKIAFSGQKLLPVLEDGGKVVADSWKIALYLDAVYGDQPALMGSDEVRGLTLTIKSWVETAVQAAMIKVVVMDIMRSITPEDQAYFRETREARFKMPLETFCVGEAGVPAVRQALVPARVTFGMQPYLAGESAGYADYILAGAFDWAETVSPIKLLEADDPVGAWLARVRAG